MFDHDLTEGLDPQQQAELGDLSELRTRLAQYTVPEPDSTWLLNALKPVIRSFPQTLPVERRGLLFWLHLTWLQVMLLEARFWWSSGCVIVVGILVSMASGREVTTLGLLLLSPLLAVVGVAYIFRPATRGLWELERISPIQPAEMLIARLLLILSFNGILALCWLLLVWDQGTQVLIWRLLLLWFGPLIGLAGISLYLSMRWNSIAGLVVPMLIWAGLILSGWYEAAQIAAETGATLSASWIAQLLGSNAPLWGAFIGLPVGLLLIWRSGRWAERWTL